MTRLFSRLHVIKKNGVRISFITWLCKKMLPDYYMVMVNSRSKRYDVTNNKIILTNPLSREFVIKYHNHREDAYKIVSSDFYEHLIKYSAYLDYNAVHSMNDFYNYIKYLSNCPIYHSRELDLYIVDALWGKKKPTEDILLIFSKVCNDSMKDRKYSRVWLKYLSSLIELEKYEEAKKVFSTFLEFGNIDDLANYLPVANYAFNNGMKSEKIISANSLFLWIYSNRDLLSKLVVNKTIAVVGNAPTEINSKNGPIIDAHDIVVRFNLYSTNTEYQNDYGKKVNIWVRNKDMGVVEEYLNRPINQYDLILFETDIWRFKIEDEFIRDLSRYVENNIPITYLRHRDELIEEVDVFPTTGLLFLYNIYKFEKLCNIDTFGFSNTMSSVAEGYDHYYAKEKTNSIILSSSHHDKMKEVRFMLDRGYIKQK